jgi:hypothetical protein
MTAARRGISIFIVVLGGILAAGCHPRANVGERTCRDRSTCAADEYCAFKPALCGKGKKPGVCRKAAPSCAANDAPVCGCDGQIHGNECAAHRAGVDLDVQGSCRQPPPRGFIPCGAHYCDASHDYCEIVLSDVFELPTDYTCKQLPAACIPLAGVARECDCFAKDTRCLSFCGHLDSGGGTPGFHLTCRR